MNTTTTRTTSPATLVSSAREGLRRRRAAQAQRRQLQAELASYRTEAELADLEATLDRYPEAEVAELRSLLHRPLLAA